MFDLFHISIFFPLLPLLIGLVRSNLKNRLFGLLSLLLLSSILFDIVNIYILPLFDISTGLGYHFFTTLEVSLYLLIFRHIFYDDRIRQLLLWIIPAFWLYKLLDLIFITGPDSLDATAMTLEAVLCIGCSLYFFHQTLQRLHVEQLERYPPFWICAGILLYFSGSLLLFLFSSYLANQGYTYFMAHWYLHAFFSLLKYVAFSIGLWWMSPTLKTSPS